MGERSISRLNGSDLTALLPRLSLLAVLLVGLSMNILASGGVGSVSVDSTVDYTDNLNIEVTPGINWDGIKVWGCGEKMYQYRSGTTSPPSNTQSYSFPIPKKAPCGYGEGTITAEVRKADTNDWVQAGYDNFKVNAKGSMDPHKGNYIVVNLDRSESDLIIKNHFLTDESWDDPDNCSEEGSCPLGEVNYFPEDDTGGKSLPKGGLIMVGDYERDHPWLRTGVIKGNYGEVISPSQSYGDTLNSNLQFNDAEDADGGWKAGRGNCYGHWTSCTSKEDVWEVLNYGFQTSNEHLNSWISSVPTVQYAGPCKVKRRLLASISEESFSSCSPLHETNGYAPTGEIIKATDPTAPNTFYGDLSYSSGDQHKDDKVNFYICREDHSNGGYEGANPDESKIVKVQEGTGDSAEWIYYRCANGEGDGTESDWKEFECPPGESVQDGPNEPNEYRCETESGESVDATFFKVENVPASNQGGSVVGGFNVSESEIQVFQNKLGTPVDTIEAECWMGQDDERPGQSEAVQMSYDYEQQSNSGPAYVLGEIPWRSGRNGTYSCVWGFTANTDGGGTVMTESTRNDPLRSKEGDWMTVNHSEIQNKYQSYNTYIDEGVDRTVWDKYSEDDERGNVDSTDEDMFSYTEAFPYCTTPNEYLILSNIVCS